MAGGSGGAILIVDDEADIRQLLALALERAGLATLQAGTADEADRLLETSEVALALLDRNLGGADGIALLRRLRLAEATVSLPVILITGRREIAERIEGLAAGADDYILKPFSPAEVVARVEATLRRGAAVARAAERNLHQRAAIVGNLARLPASDRLEETAAAVCRELAPLPGLEGAAIILIEPAGGAVALGTCGQPPWQLHIGEPVDTNLTDHLRDHATRGPWIESRSPTAVVSAWEHTGGPVACAPIFGSQLLGVLALAFQRQRAGSEDPSVALSSAIDLAVAAGAVLAPAADWGSDRDRRRHEFDELVLHRAFQPVFQPIIDLKMGQIVGFEALTRFDDGTRPDVKFVQATQVGKAVDLELATLEVALQQSSGLPGGMWLSLNVSPSLISGSNGLGELMATSTRPVVLELTEHEEVEDYDQLRKAVARLGPSFYLCVDDAGSGFASLRHVLSLSPSFVKLDRSWVHNIHDDPARQALVAGLAHFATQTGCRLIAEGIEEDQELAILRSLGIELGQGFLLGTPAPA
jgi:EAL domain-containing protein (putative c-di-GMP-specific phosphodiesterase class I)/DNA-binding NarL/FixJ family response regulator